MLRIIFAGTAEFATPTLKTLLERHNVLAVITSPDKPKGRGQKVKPSPITEVALGYVPPHSPPYKGRVIPIFTKPINKLAKQLTELKPDLIVVTAYGQLLSKEIIAIPDLGCWNIHPSLLPKYRGASPIQAAILNGDTETGVTIIAMTQEMDAGPIIAQSLVPIEPNATAGSLHDTLSDEGARLLIEALETAPFQSRPQQHKLATYTKKITSADGELLPDESAELLERKVRAYNPAPGAFIRLKSGARLKVWKAEIKKDAERVPLPTSSTNIIIANRIPSLLSSSGALLLLREVQPEGRARMSGEEFARGYRMNNQ